jgi:hypothetical protein
MEVHLIYQEVHLYFYGGTQVIVLGNFDKSLINLKSYRNSYRTLICQNFNLPARRQYMEWKSSHPLRRLALSLLEILTMTRTRQLPAGVERGEMERNGEKWREMERNGEKRVKGQEG